MDHPEEDQWWIKDPRLRNNLILDSHFRGMTPLYDIVPPHDHKYNCIAISGLASHPFGSWQPKGRGKDFMWLRDALPQYDPTIRTWIYGYDTSLKDVTSFQLVSDLACTLIDHLKADEFTSSTAPSMMFLAHSLGGIVLKEAIDRLANSGKEFDYLLYLIKGAIMFGVPNLGMEQSHLRDLVGHQPNGALIDQLAIDVEYLSALDQTFRGHQSNRKFKMFWAYETQNSRLAMKDGNGDIKMSDVRKILVSKESATSNRLDKDPMSTMAINKDHSGIVKYREGDEDCNRVLSKVHEIVKSASDAPHVKQVQSAEDTVSEVDLSPSQRTILEMPGSIPSQSKCNEHEGPNFKQEKRINAVPAEIIISTLHRAELDDRQNSVENRARHTFEWVFEKKELEFRNWLRSGVNPYWIRGKPGSGKSTLMKFILKDTRSLQQLNHYKQSCRVIVASFFFHHRGSLLQKSLEGLLRSILTQILTQQPQLAAIVEPTIKEVMSLEFPMSKQRLNEVLKSYQWNESLLWNAFRLLLHQRQYKLTMCLFLDALDEYNKTPEDIKDFLHDVGEESRAGLSNVKICFSSRPWESFTQSFKKYPGFSLHDHTIQDIRNYCYQTIERYGDSVNVVAKLVPDISETAQGVFLWARLALGDLIKATSDTTNLENLRNILQGLPKELHDYYEEILKRCGKSQKEKAYALLEIVTRSDDPLSPQKVLFVQACSDSTTFNTCRKVMEDERKKALGTDHARMTIHNACGGLLEVRKSGIKDCPHIVQLMHQTVREFVLGARFKSTMLEGARFRHENGHSFLSKYYLTGTILSASVPPYEHSTVIARHLKEAEMTTGTSQFDFLTSLASDMFSTILQEPRLRHARDVHYAYFHFGIWANLHLYLEELTSTHFRGSKEKDLLLRQFVTTIGFSAGHRGTSHIGQRFPFNFLRGLGFVFAGLTQQLFEGFLSGEVRHEISDYFPVKILGHPSIEFSMLYLHGEARRLVESLLVQEVDPVASARSLVDTRNNALYVYGSRFTTWLFDHGACPNSVDQWGRTLIDYPILFLAVQRRTSELWSLWSELVRSTLVVLEKGGQPRASKKEDWVNAAREFGLQNRYISKDTSRIHHSGANTHPATSDRLLRLLEETLQSLDEDEDGGTVFNQGSRRRLSGQLQRRSTRIEASFSELFPHVRESPDGSEPKHNSLLNRLRTRFKYIIRPSSNE
ncbi:putative NACHT domain-containing protein [Seiridium cardinale]